MAEENRRKDKIDLDKQDPSHLLDPCSQEIGRGARSQESAHCAQLCEQKIRASALGRACRNT